ncbi:MAG TPA: hypothetical protein VF844_21110 [Ktedonobacteraceae bacterium]
MLTGTDLPLVPTASSRLPCAIKGWSKKQIVLPIVLSSFNEWFGDISANGWSTSFRGFSIC